MQFANSRVSSRRPHVVHVLRNCGYVNSPLIDSQLLSNCFILTPAIHAPHPGTETKIAKPTNKYSNSWANILCGSPINTPQIVIHYLQQVNEWGVVYKIKGEFSAICCRENNSKFDVTIRVELSNDKLISIQYILLLVSSLTTLKAPKVSALTSIT